MFARSPVILFLSIIVNCIESIGAISLGFISILGYYYDIKVVLAVFMLYEFSHHANFITNILRIYRLKLISRIRNGEYSSHQEYLNRKIRLTNR